MTKFPFLRKLLGEEKEMVKRSAVTENKFAGLSLRSGTHRVNPIFKKIFARYTIYLCNNINYTQQEPRPRKG